MQDTYHTREDEAVLFESTGSVKDSNKDSEIMLTNINLVVVTRKKKLFSKAEYHTVIYPMNELKLYEGKPQIKQTSAGEVQLHFIKETITLVFDGVMTAMRFVNVVTQLITGKSLTKRGAEKVRSTIDIVDDSLGINTIDTIKNVVENGLASTLLGGIAQKVQEKNEQSSTQIGTESSAEQNEMISKLEELLAAGVLTQSEFDAKKNEVLRQ